MLRTVGIAVIGFQVKLIGGDDRLNLSLFRFILCREGIEAFFGGLAHGVGFVQLLDKNVQFCRTLLCSCDLSFQLLSCSCTAI